MRARNVGFIAKAKREKKEREAKERNSKHNMKEMNAI